MGKRHGKRGLRNPRPVSQLADEEMVPGVEGTLHRRGRDLEGLEEEDVDEGHHNKGENNGIHPLGQSRWLFAVPVARLPESPVDLLCHGHIENYNKTEQPPPSSEPDHPRDIEQGPECEPHPTVAEDLLQAHSVIYFTELIIASNA